MKFESYELRQPESYAHVEKPNKTNQSFDINFVQLNVYFNHKKVKILD